ncbi:hypothetical protein GO597_08045 [Sulfolobus acidocaldarius DSM 639]|nr:hypothetical protein GO597_08045 [Sulfolobus acidocaldarius DSM 639]
MKKSQGGKTKETYVGALVDLVKTYLKL